MTRPLPVTPVLTVDVIITIPGRGIVLVKRKHPPLGWALPGGFVEVGETLEEAAAREAREETGLTLATLRQFKAYSDPARDERFHTVTMVFSASAQGEPVGGDDAAEAAVFGEHSLPPAIAFDHRAIITEYLARRDSPPGA